MRAAHPSRACRRDSSPADAAPRCGARGGAPPPRSPGGGREAVARARVRPGHAADRPDPGRRAGRHLALRERRARLRCVCLYAARRPTRTAGGELLELADVPRYRAALEEQRAIVAHDARTDPRDGASWRPTTRAARHHLDARRAALPARRGGGRGVPRAHRAARGVDRCGDRRSPSRWPTSSRSPWSRRRTSRRACARGPAHGAPRGPAHGVARTRRGGGGARLREPADDRPGTRGPDRLADAVAPACVGWATAVLDAVAPEPRARATARGARPGGGSPSQPSRPRRDRARRRRPAARDAAATGQRTDGRARGPGARVPARSHAARADADRTSSGTRSRRPGRAARCASRPRRCGGADGTYAVLRVSDGSGDGIDEETRPRIFEPYFRHQARGRARPRARDRARARRARRRLHPGRSAPGKGTTVAIYLPVAD